MTDSTADTDKPAILHTPIVDIVCEWLLYVSAGLIVGGLMVPSVHQPAVMSWVSDGTEYNIFQVLGAMWKAEEYVIAILVGLFSILFPLAENSDGSRAVPLRKSRVQASRCADAIPWQMVYAGRLPCGFPDRHDSALDDHHRPPSIRSVSVCSRCDPEQYCDSASQLCARELAC